MADEKQTPTPPRPDGATEAPPVSPPKEPDGDQGAGGDPLIEGP